MGKQPGGRKRYAAEDGETAGREETLCGGGWGNSRAEKTLWRRKMGKQPGGENVMAAEKMQHKKASDKADAFKKERFAEF